MIIHQTLKEYEKNESLKSLFIQGWYVDKELTKYFLEKFKIHALENNLVKNTSPRNYNYIKINDNNFDLDKCLALINCYNLVFKKYQNVYEYTSFKYEGKYGISKEDFMIKCFSIGSSYDKFHYEKNSMFSNRNLASILYLNNVEEGGETEFFYQNLKIQPKEGLLLVWPAQWTHTHKGHLSNVEKYIISAYTEYFPTTDYLIDFTLSDSFKLDY